MSDATELLMFFRFAHMLASLSKLRNLHTIRCSSLSGSGKKSNALVVKPSIQCRGKLACAEALGDCLCGAILVAVTRHFFRCKFCCRAMMFQKRYRASHLVHDWNDANQVGMMSFISVHYPRFACPSSTSGRFFICGLPM